MHSPGRILLFLGGAFCLLALAGLLRLALRTTEPPAAGAVRPAVDRWPAGLGASGAPAAPGLPAGSLGALGDLVAKLEALNATAGVVPREVVLTFPSSAAWNAFRRRAADAGLRVLHADERLLTARVGYDDPQALARELRDHAGDFQGVGLNYQAWVPALQNEREADAANAGGRAPFGNSGLAAIGAAGNRQTWGRGVTAAVLDTGVTEHEVLGHTRITHLDLVQDGQVPNGHGTAMASLIAGNDASNGGVAPAARLLDVRVADVNGQSTTALVAEGIMQAVDAGAQLINISLGSTGDSPVLRRAVEYALERGVVIVAAAGNEQQAALAYPAGYEGVISVAAVDANGTQAFFSNSGSGLTLAAPGVGIVSAYSDNRMVMSSGTSQATAITSGVIAALLGWGHAPADIAGLLTQSAKATGAPATQVGAGILQVPAR